MHKMGQLKRQGRSAVEAGERKNTSSPRWKIKGEKAKRMQTPKSQCILARPTRGGFCPPKPGGWVAEICPLAGVPASSSTPAGPFSPPGGSSELPDLPGPLPKCNYPNSHLQAAVAAAAPHDLAPSGLWGAGSWKQGGGGTPIHSKVFFFCPPPPYPEIQGFLGDTWAGGGSGWNGEHPKQPLCLTAPSPGGKPDKGTGNNSRWGPGGGALTSA